MEISQTSGTTTPVTKVELNSLLSPSASPHCNVALERKQKLYQHHHSINNAIHKEVHSKLAPTAGSNSLASNAGIFSSHWSLATGEDESQTQKHHPARKVVAHSPHTPPVSKLAGVSQGDSTSAHVAQDHGEDLQHVAAHQHTLDSHAVSDLLIQDVEEAPSQSLPPSTSSHQPSTTSSSSYLRQHLHHHQQQQLGHKSQRYLQQQKEHHEAFLQRHAQLVADHHGHDIFNLEPHGSESPATTISNRIPDGVSGPSAPSPHKKPLASSAPDKVVAALDAETARIASAQQSSEQRAREQTVLKAISDRFFGRHVPLKRAFAKMDANQDGFLSPQQIRSAFEEVGLRLSDYEFSVMAHTQLKPSSSSSSTDNSSTAKIEHSKVSEWLMSVDQSKDEKSKFHLPDQRKTIAGSMGVPLPEHMDVEGFQLSAFEPLHPIQTQLDSILSPEKTLQQQIKKSIQNSSAAKARRAASSNNNHAADQAIYNKAVIQQIRRKTMEVLSKKNLSLAKVFRDLDTDGSGEIDLSELRVYVGTYASM